MNEVVPSTANAFEEWLTKNGGRIPRPLFDLGLRAMWSLSAMEAGAAHQSEVTDAMNKRDLQAFVEAYEAWKS
jgi:hypothetical protein